MTYAAFEASIESSQPVELYEIVLGALIFRYTSTEDDQVVGGLTYQAIPMKRGTIENTPEDSNRSFTVDFPGSNPFVRNYIAVAPSQDAKLTVKRIQRADAEVITMFTGTVKSVAFSENGDKATIVAEIDLVSASRPMPRYTFQSSCNNCVYDSHCAVSPSDPRFHLTAVVTAQSGNTITVPGASGFGTGWFTAGECDAIGGLDARLILDHTGDVITLMLPFPFNAIGQVVTLLAGCDHQDETCDGKFTNIDNFEAFTFVPLKNIFRTGIASAQC